MNLDEGVGRVRRQGRHEAVLSEEHLEVRDLAGGQEPEVAGGAPAPGLLLLEVLEEVGEVVVVRGRRLLLLLLSLKPSLLL